MIDHQEEWQVFDTNGEAVADQSVSPDYSREGASVIVGAVHVWIWRQSSGSIEVLLQRRAKRKPTWPNHLDISFAGHIDAGESRLEAAVREGDEEIGIELETANLEYIFSYRNFKNGIKWVYLYEEHHAQDYIFNDGEVEDLIWVTFDAFKTMVKNPEEYGLVPHPAEYYGFLLSALDENH